MVPGVPGIRPDRVGIRYPVGEAMSDPTAEILPIEEPATAVAVLQTRCGCSSGLEVKLPPPRTITVELAPIKGDEKAIRTFYATGKQVEIPGPEPRQTALLYVEGPNPTPRIIVPGGTQPSRLLR